MIDLPRLLADLGRIAQRLERTDATAAITLQAVIHRLNDGRYERAETSVGQAISEVAERIEF